jgi:Flp pilus assembly protein TadB
VFYERLCSISSKIPLIKQLGARKEDRELRKAVSFLAPLMTLTVQGIAAASYLSTLIVLISLVLLLTYVGISLIIVLPVSLLSALVVYFIVLSYPVSVMNGYKLSLSEEADLVFEQFILVFQSGGTIFDAIEMVAKSDHPYLSTAFQDILQKVDQGIAPEESLSQFAKDQPSDDLRRYITGILSSLEQKTEMLDLLSGESYEADMTLRQKNLELESRLLIVAALATYIPIMFTLALSLAGYATNLLVLLIAPFFILLNALMKSRFSNQFSAYFDRPNKPGVLAPSQPDIILEYEEFLNFLILLSERLRSGDTLEVALPEVRDDCAPEIQKLLDLAINSVYWKGESIGEAVTLAAKNALGQRVANLLNMIPLMCEASARDAGDRLSKIATRLIQRSAVAKERDSILAAQRLKVHLLSVTSSIVLGLMAALSPFLFIGSLLSEGPIWTPDTITLVDIAPLFVALLITTASTGYQNTQMVGGRRALLIGFLCALLFAVSFVLSSSILGLNLT